MSVCIKANHGEQYLSEVRRCTWLHCNMFFFLPQSLYNHTLWVLSNQYLIHICPCRSPFQTGCCLTTSHKKQVPILSFTKTTGFCLRYVLYIWNIIFNLKETVLQSSWMSTATRQCFTLKWSADEQCCRRMFCTVLAQRCFWDNVKLHISGRPFIV